MSAGLSVPQVQALLAAPDLLAAVRPGDLTAATRLRVQWPADLVAAATAQAELRVAAGAKFDRADQMLFTRPGLEQATALPVAGLPAARLVAAAGPGDRIVDLCCGVGGDAIAIGLAQAAAGSGGAGGAGGVLAVDRDPVPALLCRHNARVYGVAVHPAVADVTAAAQLAPGDVVHVDPARRDPSAPGVGGRRGGYQPALAWCASLPAERVCVKVAPGITTEERPEGWETEWISVRRELKLALLWSPALAEGSRRATVMDADGVPHTRIADPDAAPAPVGEPGEWVVDPDPAVTRAGAVGDLAAEIGGRLIDPRIAFVVTDDRPATPWGRVLRVAASLPFAERKVAAELRRLAATDLQIRRRGLAGDVTALGRRLLPPADARAGQPLRITLLLTRHRDRPWALLTTDPAEPYPG